MLAGPGTPPGRGAEGGGAVVGTGWEGGVGTAVVGLADGGGGGAGVPATAGGAAPVGVTLTDEVADVVTEGCAGDGAGRPDEVVPGVDRSVGAPSVAEPTAELEAPGGADVVELGASAAAGGPDFALVDSWLTAYAPPEPSAATPIRAATSGVPNRFARGNRTDEAPHSVSRHGRKPRLSRLACASAEPGGVLMVCGGRI
ncbi:MAG: hypothetical protein QOG69_787 [Actinomycetota bacterium]|nr:hypothetical protein [Actinomycetota bacterium]